MTQYMTEELSQSEATVNIIYSVISITGPTLGVVTGGIV
jgi:hypothetical protein